MKPKISVIVPNYQGSRIFPKCIRSLLKQNYPNIQIVLVDDSSTDGSFELAKRLFAGRITIVQTPRNSGFVGACNHAYKFCKGEYVIFTNNDATFPKNWVSEMYASVAGKPKTIGATILLQGDDPHWIERLIAKGKYGSFSVIGTDGIRRLNPLERKTGLIEVFGSGVCIAPKKAIGSYLFAPDYFAYCEDIEFCWRMRLKGYDVVVNSNAKMRHYGGYTRKKVASFNRRAIMHGTKNRITNFLVFYEMKNLIRLLPPFIVSEIGAFLKTPKAMPLRLQSYWYVLTHFLSIMRRRREIQRTRKVDDKVIMRLMTYKMLDETLTSTPGRAKVIRGFNACVRLYYKVVGIRTFDIDNPNATPQMHESAVVRLD